jgi:hypothetical protein
MQIREASAADIPTIVSLLKTSLGESLLPKSSVYWNWKHENNPFGRSPVYLAWEGDQLAGVRAFMRWEWINDKNEVFKAVRAVDTATHPDFQGKGIFKKLTLGLVDACTKAGDDFVFNTPNQNSMPGYLKMGWEKAGKLPLCISFARPFGMMQKLMGKVSQPSGTVGQSMSETLSHPGLPMLLKQFHQQTSNITTRYSVDFLRWRYQAVPIVEYFVVADTEGSQMNALLFGRLKDSRLGREFRITDCFVSGIHSPKKFRTLVHESIKASQADYVTIAATSGDEQKRIAGMLRWRLPVGPIVTVRALNYTALEQLRNFSQWSPGIGDLELF